MVAFSIVGSVIGAGFITGKEIYEFFAFDFSVSGLYLAFLCFAIEIYFIMNLNDTAIEKVVVKLVAIANIVIAAGMISAFEKLLISVFPLSKNIKIITIISAILVFTISCSGVGALQKFNAFLTPCIIVSIVVLSILKIEYYPIEIYPKTINGVFNPLIYTGFNLILSLGIIKSGGENLSPPSKILSSILTSLFLCICICLISLAVKGLKSSEMPFVELFSDDKKLSIIVDIITIFAIFTTLASSFYTAVNFGGVKLPSGLKIILFLICLAISKIGFSSIVERCYPIIGVLGNGFIILICLLSKFFPKGQREHTLIPPKRIG